MPQQVSNLDALTVLIDEYSDPIRPKIVMVFDAVTKENHKLSAKVTEFPVENGVIISDHIIHNPTTIELESVVSNNPINQIDLVYPEHIVGSALYNPSQQLPSYTYVPGTYTLPQNTQAQPKLSSSYYNAKTPTENRAKAAYTTLRNYFDLGTPLKVVTKLSVYPNMVITGINTTRDSKTTEAWIASISLQQVIFTRNVYVQLKPKAKKLPRNSKKPVDKGQCAGAVKEYDKTRADLVLFLSGSDEVRLQRIKPVPERWQGL